MLTFGFVSDLGFRLSDFKREAPCLGLWTVGHDPPPNPVCNLAGSRLGQGLEELSVTPHPKLLAEGLPYQLDPMSSSAALLDADSQVGRFAGYDFDPPTHSARF